MFQLISIKDNGFYQLLTVKVIFGGDAIEIRGQSIIGFHSQIQGFRVKNVSENPLLSE